MFSKRGHSFLIAVVSLLVASIVTYVACQYKYFKIDTEIKVIDLLLSAGTIAIGLYIAIVLEVNRSKNQNYYVYVEGKYDSLWELFIQFSSVLELSPNIELSETTKWFKTFDQKLTPLIKLVESFEYDSKCLTKIEKKIDELEEYISNNPNIKDQILELTNDKPIIVQKLKEINELFAKSFKELAQ